MTARYQTLFLLTAAVSLTTFGSETFVPAVAAGEPVVTFDVPALLGARELPLDEIHSTTSAQKTIEVIVPVTSEIPASDAGQLSQFRFDVFWNRNPFPICDYGPKTQTFSEIEGTISIEKSSDKKSTMGLNLTGGYQNLVSGTGKAEVGGNEGSKIHYQEIPQHEILIAAGTIRRGTGAFFRFHPSRLETLEGGRNLVVAFQVPRSWRGGVLQIECTATGTRKVLAWSESFDVSRAFIVPIYLDSDDQARESAMEFVRREQGLRRSWQRHVGEASNSKSSSFSTAIFGSSVKKNSVANLPADWVHYLIQTNDSALEKYRSQLPEDLAIAASEFVHSRDELLKFSR